MKLVTWYFWEWLMYSISQYFFGKRSCEIELPRAYHETSFSRVVLCSLFILSVLDVSIVSFFLIKSKLQLFVLFASKWNTPTLQHHLYILCLWHFYLNVNIREIYMSHPSVINPQRNLIRYQMGTCNTNEQNSLTFILCQPKAIFANMPPLI